jgi:hypothetical protein
MSDDFQTAYAHAVEHAGRPHWWNLSPGYRIAEIYRELRTLDAAKIVPLKPALKAA